jgi:hypothetical protein
MTGPVVEATTKLTKGQWRVLLRRILKQEGGQLTPKAAEEIMKYEPPVEKTLGTLFPKGQEESMFRTPLRLPIEEAREKYFQNPEAFTPGRHSGMGPVNELKTVPMGSPEDLAAGISYERQKFAPIVPSSVQQIAGKMQGQEKQGLIERALTERGVKQGDLAIPAEKFLQQEGASLELPENTVRQVLQKALMADNIWKEMGGGRSTAGQLWNRMLSLQTGGVKQHFKTGRDWFISSFNNYEKNPQNFSQKHPREAELIKKIKELYSGVE